MTGSTGLRFDGETAIVTGAGRGLGRHYAMELAGRGAHVIVNNRPTPSASDPGTTVAEAVVAAVRAAGGSAEADHHDVSSTPGAEGVVRAALDLTGRVDVLVCNAGIINFSPLADLGDEAWDEMMAAHAGGTFRLGRAVWPHFVAQGSGRIVNTTSNAGYAACALNGHYGAAKAAVASITRSQAIEGAPHGIRSNAVAPMAVTRMNSEMFFGGASEESATWVADIASGEVPIGPSSIVAPTVVWLAHRDSTPTGEIYTSSSGKVARVATVIGPGHFDPAHVAEDLAARQDELRSIEGGVEAVSAGGEIGAVSALFQSGGQSATASGATS